MKYKLRHLLISVLLLVQISAFTQYNYKIDSQYKLIAHRGGVVDEKIPENSIDALKKAVKTGYWMVEVDMRLTKDSVFITQHDNTFNRFFGVGKRVSDMTWEEIKKLRTQTGSKVQSLEDVLKFCSKNNINVMIDNKVRGNDTVLFSRVVTMLDRYNLRKDALMIGTDESTEFFTGKVRLSCVRKQLENNMMRKDYKTSDYYLFANPTKEDMIWAKENDIMVVGVINALNLPEDKLLEDGKEKAEYLKNLGIKIFQIDSMYDIFFR
jgi:glycerophosphoryl diester phosphodiesterase